MEDNGKMSHIVSNNVDWFAIYFPVSSEVYRLGNSSIAAYKWLDLQEKIRG